MKKIIATVLAMVMALALCTTAFAANPKYTKAYTNDGTEYVAVTGSEYEVATDAAVSYNKTTGAGELKTFTVSNCTIAAGKDYIEATAADYDLKLTADGRAPLYLSEVAYGGAYVCKAVAFTAIGEKCEQYNGDTSDKYFVNSGNYMSDDTAVLFVKSETGSVNVLVNGELVRVNVVGVLDNVTVPHDWKAASYDKDNKVATYKCDDCGTVATVYKTKDAAKAAGAGTVTTFGGNVIGYTYNVPGAGASGSTTGTKPSPKTFDAGIALYAAMALTSVAGSAVVIGKKKEF